MNTFKTINTEYLRASRTIETILVSNTDAEKLYFIYNYEGNSYRVFENQLNLIGFFQEKRECDFHFSSDDEVDEFLSKVEVAIQIYPIYHQLTKQKKEQCPLELAQVLELGKEPKYDFLNESRFGFVFREFSTNFTS